MACRMALSLSRCLPRVSAFLPRASRSLAEALLAAESRCTDLYVLARPDAAQMAPGQELRMTPVML